MFQESQDLLDVSHQSGRSFRSDRSPVSFNVGPIREQSVRSPTRQEGSTFRPATHIKSDALAHQLRTYMEILDSILAF